MDKIRDVYESVLEKLIERTGSETNARVLLSGGIGVVILIIIAAVAFVAGGVPLISAPAVPDSDGKPNIVIGSSVTGSQRGEEARGEENLAALPDEAKTVNELAQSPVVKAKAKAVVSPTVFICTLPNGEDVTVRLLDVVAGPKNTLVEGGALPFELAAEGKSIWLERAKVTQDADGVWPRYIWTLDPEQSGVDAIGSLYNVKMAKLGTEWYTYAPEEGADKYAEDFIQATVDQEALDEAAAKEKEEAQRLEWEKRRQEAEKKEAKSNDTDAELE